MNDTNRLMGHRNTQGLSELGKRVIDECPNAYVNKLGQVIDPCHVWFSAVNDATSWDISNKESDHGD